MARYYREGDAPIPGYRLIQELGRGGFGVVWKASAPGNLDVALKFINLASKPGQKELRALQVVRGLRHPNLIPVTAFWLCDKDGAVLPDATEQAIEAAARPSIKLSVQDTAIIEDGSLGVVGSRAAELVIAMGLAEKSLFRRLEECQRAGLVGLPTSELLKYMEDAARAIDYLNSPVHVIAGTPMAVQHCDVKPHNILIVGGAAQLCDFGLARFLGDVKSSATHAGTIAYAAPEVVASGLPSEFSDQYSLAVSYVELRTGELPYENEGWMEVMAAVQEGQLDLSRLPSAERDVISRATSLKPKERFPTAMDMVSALRAAVVGRPTAASRADLRGTMIPDRRATSSDPFPRSNPAVAGRDEPSPVSQTGGGGVWTLVALAMLLVVGGGWVASGFWAGPDRGKLLGSQDPSKNRPGDASKTSQGTVQVQGKQGDKNLKATPGKTPKNTVTQPAVKSSNAQAISVEARRRKLAGMLAAGQAQAALTEANAALKEHPNDAELYFLRGRSLWALNRASLALRDFDEAARRSPEYAGRSEALAAQAASAEELLSQQRWKDARELASRVIDARQSDAPAAIYFLRGQALVELGELDLAVDDFEAAARRDRETPPKFVNRPEHAQAYLKRAEQRFRSRHMPSAAADAGAALRIDPSSAAAYLLRGTCSLELEDYKSAAADFDQALRLDPNNPSGYSRRGVARMEQGEYRDSIEDFTRAIEIDPHFTDYLNRGRAHLDSGVYELALADFNEVLKREPNAAAAYFFRAEAHRRLDRLPAALADCDQALRLNPNNSATHLKRGQLLTALNRPSEAIDEFTLALRQGYFNAAFVFDLRADAQKQAKRPDDEQADRDLAGRLSKAVTDRTNAEVRRELAFDLATNAEPSRRFGKLALELATEACELTQYADGPCLDALAVASAELGEFEAAVKWSRRAIDRAVDTASRSQYESHLRLFTQRRKVDSE